MKKSYHSSEVPIRLATMTRRTDEGATVAGGGLGGDIGPLPESAGIAGGHALLECYLGGQEGDKIKITTAPPRLLGDALRSVHKRVSCIAACSIDFSPDEDVASGAAQWGKGVLICHPPNGASSLRSKRWARPPRRRATSLIDDERPAGDLGLTEDVLGRQQEQPAQIQAPRAELRTHVKIT